MAWRFSLCAGGYVYWPAQAAWHRRPANGVDSGLKTWRLSGCNQAIPSCLANVCINGSQPWRSGLGLIVILNEVVMA